MHLPSCEKCTDCFAVISELCGTTAAKLKSLQLSFAVSPSAHLSTSQDDDDSSEVTEHSPSTAADSSTAGIAKASEQSSVTASTNAEVQEQSHAATSSTNSEVTEQESRSATSSSNSTADDSQVVMVDDWMKKTVKELKDECKLQGLTVSGKKLDLATRLFKHVEEDKDSSTTGVDNDTGIINDWMKKTANELKEECKLRGMIVGGTKKELAM